MGAARHPGGPFSFVHRLHGMNVTLATIGPRMRRTVEMLLWLNGPPGLSCGYRDRRDADVKFYRIAAAMAGGLAAAMAAAPAQAQFYFQSQDITGAPVQGNEPGVGLPMPGATPAEIRAQLVWNMRAALNVAALQCQFEPTLLTVSNYNAVLKDHSAELKGAFDTLNKYFVRVSKTKAAGQTALDQYGTRTYASFGTVAGQYGFCQTAHFIGRDAVFTKRGEFGSLASTRMRELRNSMVPFGEQRFPRYVAYGLGAAPLPRLDAACWDKKGEWVTKRCGASTWPPAPGVGVAAR